MQNKYKNMSNSSKNSGGTGICLIIFLIFLTLKLAGVGVVANWSWWAVTSPLWVPIVVLLLIVTIISIINKAFDIVS